ncbi:hypothetical protein [Streptomyces purpurascens]|uniref:Secreted protein n=1 Tax=Streptomyces purpurascens TaxID=1924 RepID=A0ABZ1MR96_STREF|nr:hypothetical protein [Streptomyces purpurascens]MCE7045688.1 hypothetical protein [Streptomyces purpurascens]GHA08315.1 hypothetical protein GCM10010303_17730 [Streptomyces purpurascens]
MTTKRRWITRRVGGWLTAGCDAQGSGGIGVLTGAPSSVRIPSICTGREWILEADQTRDLLENRSVVLAVAYGRRAEREHCQAPAVGVRNVGVDL